MTKYKARVWKDKDTYQEHWYVEKTHPIYGWPAVEIPKQPKFTSKKAAEDYAKKLNETTEQLTLF